MKPTLYIVGAGGHGRVVWEAAELSGAFAACVLVDARPEAALPLAPTATVLAMEALPPPGPAVAVISAVGRTALRMREVRRFLEEGYDVSVVTHPTAFVSPRAKLGPGTVCLAQSAVLIGAETGPACIVNTGASVDHDCRLGEGVHAAPGARLAGGVLVDAGAHVGVNASVIQNVHIGAHTIVGAGAAVTADLPAGVVAVGVPAKVIRQRPPEEYA